MLLTELRVYSNLNATQVSIFTPDISGPELISYELNLQTDIVSLTFSEPILIDNITLTGFVLSSDPASQSISRRLTGGLVQNDGYATNILNVLLSQSDIAFIKLQQNLATEINNTYLSIDNDTLYDTFQNPNNLIFGISPTQVVPDMAVSFTSLASYNLDFQHRLFNIDFY